MQTYLKAVMAVLGAVLTSLAVYYGHTTWYPIVVSGVTALSVYLVPNAPKAPATPPNPPAPVPAQMEAATPEPGQWMKEAA